MRILCFVLMVCGSVEALAQPQKIDVSFALRTDPPSQFLSPRFEERSGGHVSEGYPHFYRRYVFDNAKRVVFGYELLLTEQGPGTYLASFGPLILSLLELSVDPHPVVEAPSTIDRTEWIIQPLPAMPAPQIVHTGDAIGVELSVDDTTGVKLFDDIHVIPLGDPRVPSVSGTPRDFTAADEELRIFAPLVTINGTRQDAVPTSDAHGSLVWFYVPARGRFILSLLPRRNLDFKLAGEARGGAITLTVGRDSIKLECPISVVDQNAPYNLYVLHEPEWEPAAQEERGWFAMGSVNPRELGPLKKK